MKKNLCYLLLALGMVLLANTACDWQMGQMSNQLRDQIISTFFAG